MHENIGPIRGARYKAIAFQPVEPFDANRLKLPGAVDHVERVIAAGGTLQRRLRIGSDCGGQIKVEDFARLTAPVALNGKTGDHRPFGQGPAPDIPQHGEMDEHVAAAIIRHDEAIAAHRVKPFDRAAHLYVVGSPIFVVALKQRVLWHSASHATHVVTPAPSLSHSFIFAKENYYSQAQG